MKHLLIGYSFLLIFICLAPACQNKTELAGFDSESWKKDRLACTGKRGQMKDAFEKIRPQLKGLTQMEIIDVLGRPDLQRLDERNTKSYLYYLEPGGECPGGQTDAKVIIVRFNSVDRSFEIIYERGTPL